jgi:hypothetical protein
MSCSTHSFNVQQTCYLRDAVHVRSLLASQGLSLGGCCIFFTLLPLLLARGAERSNKLGIYHPATNQRRPPCPLSLLPHPQQPCFAGPLVPDFANLTALTKLDLYTSNLYGTLPAEWAAPDAFQELSFLRLSFNNATGTVPPEWGRPGAFPRLRWVGFRKGRVQARSELHLSPRTVA